MSKQQTTAKKLPPKLVDLSLIGVRRTAPKLVDLSLIGVRRTAPKLVDLSLIGVRRTAPKLVDLSLIGVKAIKLYGAPTKLTRLVFYSTGYISGTGDGIVTVGGVPACREIFLALSDRLAQGFTHRSFSTDKGHYLITNLDPNAKYLIMARDYKGEYEPCVCDNVVPASDLTADELGALWQSWQS